MPDRDYIQRPVDEGYRRGVESMGQGPRVSAGEWFEAIARMLAAGLAMRGGVGMPGGIASKRDILTNMGLQTRQGSRGVMGAPGVSPPTNTVSGLRQYPEIKGSYRSDTTQPLGRAEYMGHTGKVHARTPQHEREGLWDQMLEYLIGTSRQ